MTDDEEEEGGDVGTTHVAEPDAASGAAVRVRARPAIRDDDGGKKIGKELKFHELDSVTTQIRHDLEADNWVGAEER